MRALGVIFVCLQIAAAQPVLNRNLGTVKPGKGPAELHVVAFGDWGYRGAQSGQQSVAAAIGKLHAENPFHLGLLLGDNFYPAGITSVDDPQWLELWENGYAKLGIPFFASLGNHDYDGNEQAEIDYSKKSQTWKMPFNYDTFTAGPVQFFAIDTDEGNAGRFLFRPAWSDAQANWLDSELSQSQASWKIVYGHHPIYSDGHHGDDGRLVAKLLPILIANKVDLYLCGHEHDLEFLERNGLQFVIAGGGGKDVRKVKPRRAEFAEGRNGFLDLSASAERLEFKLRGADGAALFTKTRAQTRTARASPRR